MTEPVGFTGSTDHLAAEFALLDARLRHLAAAEASISTPDVDQLAADIDTAVAATEAPLRLVVLGQMFGLAAFDVDVVVACLAAEVDASYGRRYALLHDDAERAHPSVGLLLDLLCGRDLPARLAGRRRFAADAPLRRHGLVRLVEPDRPAALPGVAVVLERRVAGFLLEEDAPDPALAAVCRVELPSAGLGELVLPEPVATALKGLAARPAADLVVHLRGAPGAGRGAIAAALAAEWGAALLTVDSAQVAATPPDALPDLLRAIDRETLLDGAVPCWAEFDELLASDQRRRVVLDAFAEHPGPVIVCTRAAWAPDEPRLGVVPVEVPAPGYADRVRLWSDALGPAAETAAARYRIGAGRVHAIAGAATAIGRARGAATPSADDVGAAAREHTRLALDGLARRVDGHHTWADVVLPADRTAQLREIADQVRHRAVVHEQWGFPGSAAGGQGVTLLFAGPPGTGKTMAAGVLARDLGLDLYVVDLAATVSKYIGETERNLGKVFDAAAGGTAVLFFDEADALFGKRTQVRDAHDRYANLQTSYLLQRLESHDGVVVLATNLRKNMDDAFTRRLAATVEFPLPDAADRLRLWQGVWPAGVPRADLDLELLAREVALAGGNIHNIALAAAFRAAADGGVVTMAHVLAAAGREYRKLGTVDLPVGLGS
ncbi:ATP-binding protein [Pseudonocardia sp. CA-107938]|uniref:ATP-binding protein n=1 Tax=Pseudonocardia sp. CA-107938 TaxID=3240021 RepID=UPI003D8E4E5A